MAVGEYADKHTNLYIYFYFFSFCFFLFIEWHISCHKRRLRVYNYLVDFEPSQQWIINYLNIINALIQ